MHTFTDHFCSLYLYPLLCLLSPTTDSFLPSPERKPLVSRRLSRDLKWGIDLHVNSSSSSSSFSSSLLLLLFFSEKKKKKLYRDIMCIQRNALIFRVDLPNCFSNKSRCLRRPIFHTIFKYVVLPILEPGGFWGVS